MYEVSLGVVAGKDGIYCCSACVVFSKRTFSIIAGNSLYLSVLEACMNIL